MDPQKPGPSYQPPQQPQQNQVYPQQQFMQQNQGHPAPNKHGRLQQSYAKEIELPYGGTYEGIMDCLGGIVGTCGSIPCCFCCPNPYNQVQQVLYKLTSSGNGWFDFAIWKLL